MDLFKKYIDNFILFFLFTGIVSLFTECLMTPKTISAIMLYFFLIYKHLVLKEKFPSGAKKSLLILLFLFFVSLCLSAIFSEMPLYSFEWIKKSYWVSIPLGLAVLSIGYKKNVFKIILLAFITVFILNNLHFYLKAVKECHTWDLFSKTFIPDRNYTFYLGLLLPFALSSLLVFNNLIFRCFLILNIFFSLAFLFPIGSRGAFVTIFLEIILWIIFVSFLMWKNNKKIIITGWIVLLLGFSFLAYKYHSHPMVKGAIKRRLSPNGRNIIIKDRFFLVLKHRPVLGIGYGRLLYFNFLEKYHVPKRCGRYDSKEKRFIYYSDEGIFLQTIIRQGLIGALIFILLFLYSLKEAFLKCLKTKIFIEKGMFFAIFSVLIAHYFIRGLVETLSLTYFVFFIFIIAIPLSNKDNK